MIDLTARKCHHAHAWLLENSQVLLNNHSLIYNKLTIERKTTETKIIPLALLLYLGGNRAGSYNSRTEKKSAPTKIETVVVRSRNLIEHLQDVPLSISVVNGPYHFLVLVPASSTRVSTQPITANLILITLCRPTDIAAGN